MSGLPWFELETGFADHPRFVRLGVLLSDERAGWHVLKLWSYCYDKVTDRFYGQEAAAMVELVAGWRGEPGRFVEAALACGGHAGVTRDSPQGSREPSPGFLLRDGNDLVVHGIARRLEVHRMKKEADRLRQANARERLKKKYAPAGEADGENVTRDSRRTSRANKNRNQVEDPPVVPLQQGVWAKALATLRRRAKTPDQRAVVSRWLEPLEAREIDDGLWLFAPTQHHRDFVHDNYRDAIAELVGEVAALHFDVRRGAAREA